jgi:hypothetical protein
MGDSPDPPPPPPDYTKQRAEFSAAEAASRKQKADAYNAQVSAFNNQLSGYGGQIADWQGKTGGLNLTNDELFTGYIGDLSNLQNQLYGLNFNSAKPVFDSMVYSPYGAVSVDAPALLDVNYGMRDNYINQLGSLSSKINSLQQQRMSEEQKMAQYSGNLFSQLSGVNSALSNAKIGDLSTLNNYKTQLDTLQANKNAFTSPILGDYDPFSWSQIDPTYQMALDRFNGLMAQRQAEIDRVNSFEQGIVDKAANLRSMYDGLNIGNETGINDLQSAIDAYQRDTSRFTTQLNASDYDLSQELGDVQSVEDLLGELRAKRLSEQSRVGNAQQNFQNQALQLASAARTSDIYNSGRLSDLQAQIAALTGQIGNFSSELPTDFGLAKNQLSSAEGLIAQLLSQRGTTVDQLRGRMDAATSGIGSIADYDEAAMNQALTRLMGLQNQLSPFMGSDVDPQKLQLQNSVSDINNMMMNLSGKRSGFETEAQTMLNQLTNGSYTSMDMLDPLFTQANDLQTRARQYQAMQAYDELTQIMSKLNAEKSRLTTDQQNVAAQTLLDQQNALSGGTNLNDIMNRISPEQYASLMQLAQKAQQGDQNSLDQYNAFLRSLGVGV